MKRLVLAAVLLAAASEAAAAARPNIIFIMSDDHAAQAISAYGSRVNQTPNIDRLGREGLRLDNAFVTNSICTPSRAAILTGQYAHLNGVPVFNRFDSARDTVAEAAAAGWVLHGHGGEVAPRQRSRRLRPLGDLPGQGAYFDPILYTATGEKTYTGRYATGRRHGHRHRLPEDAAGGQAVLPHAPPQGPASALGAGRVPSRAVREPLDPGAGDVVGLLHHADGRPPGEPAARRGRPHAA
jgi:hypothetical protein